MSIDHDNHPDEDLLFFRKMEVKEIKMESGNLEILATTPTVQLTCTMFWEIMAQLNCTLSVLNKSVGSIFGMVDPRLDS